MRRWSRTLRSLAARRRDRVRLGVAVLAGCAAAAIAVGAQAQSQREIRIGSDPAGNAAGRRPQEAVFQLPPYPKEDHFVEFFVSSASDFKYFIDGKTISIDGPVIGYTLVARSPEGVDNVSREAIHCATDEYRIYATGHTRDRSWSQRPTPWRHVEPASVARWRFALLRDYFCPGGAPIFTAAEGIDALRRGRHSLIDQGHRF